MHRRRSPPRARNSSAKSRSETASSELAAGRSKPSAFAVASRSIGKDVPASAAAPSGHSLSRRRAVGEAARGRGPASRHRRGGDGRRSPAAPTCRWVKPGMMVAAWRSAWAMSAACSAIICAVEPVDRVAHPEPEIGRHLVVARARGVQPPGRRADQLGEPRLDIEVDVLVLGAEREGAAPRSRRGFAARPSAIAVAIFPATGCAARPAWRNARASRRCPGHRAACRNRSRR